MGDTQGGPEKKVDPVPLKIGKFPVEISDNASIPCIDDGKFLISDRTQWSKLRNDQWIVKDLGVISFIGIDDNAPFVTEITDEAYSKFTQGGSRAFYAFLKPALIRKFERKTKTKAKRQGDLWAVLLPFSETDFSTCCDILDMTCSDSPLWRKHKAMGVFETRHKFTGRIFDIPFDENEYEPAMICEGTLIAPNHPPLVLKGIHLVMQSDGLAGGGD